MGLGGEVFIPLPQGRVGIHSPYPPPYVRHRLLASVIITNETKLRITVKN